jgi:hypothetical protein
MTLSRTAASPRVTYSLRSNVMAAVATRVEAFGETLGRCHRDPSEGRLRS